MATWKKIITTADDASYSNSSIEAGDIPTLNQHTTGQSGTALVLANSRTFRTRLGNTALTSFNGGTNCFPGVEGTLAEGNGGTGLGSISTLLNSNVTLTTLGGTTLGQNLFTAVNNSSSAARFIKVSSVQAGNTISLRSAGNARTDLGVAIGTDVQAYNANLQSIATNCPPNLNSMMLGDGTDWSSRGQSTILSFLGVESGATADQSAAQILTAIKTVDVNGTAGVNAGTLGGQLPSVSAGNNTIVQRTGSGYIFANYFNTSPNDVANGSISKMLVESNHDGYMRHATASTVRDFLGVENLAAADQTQADINNLQITKLGTLTAGTWNAGVIADGYLSTNTAHLSETQTFTGSKTFTGSTVIGGTTMPSSTGSAKQVLSITGAGSASWTDNVKYGYTTLAYQSQWYASAKKWYSCSSTYGANYYNWNKSWTTAVPNNWDYAHATSSLKSYGMPIVVPISGTIHSWGWHGVYNSSSTYYFRILKGDPTYGNTQTGIAISTVGSEVSASALAGRFVKVEVASTQSVTRGDIIVPVMKNNSISTSTKYGRGQFYITFKVDLGQ